MPKYGNLGSEWKIPELGIDGFFRNRLPSPRSHARTLLVVPRRGSGPLDRESRAGAKQFLIEIDRDRSYVLAKKKNAVPDRWWPTIPSTRAIHFELYHFIDFGSFLAEAQIDNNYSFFISYWLLNKDRMTLVSICVLLESSQNDIIVHNI